MGFPGCSVVKNIPVWSLGREDHLEKEMATHSSILAWEIPWTEEPGRLQSMGSQRVWHNCVQTHTHTHIHVLGTALSQLTPYAQTYSCYFISRTLSPSSIQSPDWKVNGKERTLLKYHHPVTPGMMSCPPPQRTETSTRVVKLGSCINLPNLLTIQSPRVHAWSLHRRYTVGSFPTLLVAATATKIQKSLQLVKSDPSDIDLYVEKGTESP